jgi:hypothetical protein
MPLIESPYITMKAKSLSPMNRTLKGKQPQITLSLLPCNTF